ncbi:MAG: 1-phosphofructokinase family hexose kinase [Candidatus Omnitrophica bacterium]|nr:1-phosphofructokinase family hexose kinase [Candidatus Omnitrophota bacterium]MCM8806700.1 1-phosphofructokinase family hexose kinase [Candidatus Omnitrophota bacterium]
MPSLIYTISLNSSIDYTFYLKDIVDEDVNRIDKIRVDPGGKGMNIARMLKNLGEEAVAITFLSKNNGEFYKTLLEKEKINFIPVEIEGNLRNIYNFISEKRVLRFNEKGPKIKKKELKKFWQILMNINFKKEDIVVMSGSIPPGIKNNIYAEIIKKLKKFRIFTVVDADGIVLKESIKEKPFIIKPNLKELERAFNYKIDNFDKLKQVCNFLVNTGISLILITNGKNGSILFTKKEIIYSKSPEVNFKSSIGCGDAFLAGFLYMFKRKKDNKTALKFASAVGAAKAEEEGTKMPEKSRIKKLFNLVKLYENPKDFKPFFNEIS